MSNGLDDVVRRLGSAMDDVRDAAFDRVEMLMREEASQWTEVEFMKLWKGLFYAMWNLDGDLNQVIYCQKITHELHSF